MPQGSWLGPLIFIILIDDLQPQLLTHKFVDDTTLSEIAKGSTSEMQRTVDELVKWSKLNCLNINSNKTKELVIGSLSKESVVPLTFASTTVQRVSVYKILEVMVNYDLK